MARNLRGRLRPLVVTGALWVGAQDARATPTPADGNAVALVCTVAPAAAQAGRPSPQRILVSNGGATLVSGAIDYEVSFAGRDGRESPTAALPTALKAGQTIEIASGVGIRSCQATFRTKHPTGAGKR